MTTVSDIERFIHDAQNKVIIAGYGSLLSQYSRETYSQILSTSLAVDVKGWQRGWITRSTTEHQTYAGAVPDSNSRLCAQLIALQFDEKFEKREKDYRFSRLQLSDIDLNEIQAKHQNSQAWEALLRLLDSVPIYICETLDAQTSSTDFPVNYSYINTCIQGSYEKRANAGIASFFEHTQGWDSGVFNDDITNPLYSRATISQNLLWNTKSLIENAIKQSL